DLLGGEDQIALVLPVLVVDDHHGLARGDVGDRALDAVEPHVASIAVPAVPDVPCDRRRSRSLHQGSSRCAVIYGALRTSRSTYLASTSTSRLTRVPTAVRPKM